MIPVDNTVTQFLKIIEYSHIDWDSKRAGGKWSAKEIIGHLIDSAQVNLERFVRCTYQENFKLVYAQDEWVNTKRYQDTDVNELLELWRLTNRQIQRVLDNYPADRWQVKCDNNAETEELNTVEFLATDYVQHMQHHLQQIISYKP
jgi:hypothetical protein